ncbi:MAG: PASTA domain-containing protein [Deltaproteobacteria bacterium]|nr:PASTA domain-containing protein [Deltaproteobacteria bacterium]
MISRVLKIAVLLFVFILIVGASAYLTLTMIIKSEDTVIVPDLAGKSIVYVLELLTDLGLNTKVEGSEYSTETPKNNVIFQEPEPGSEIKKGRDVRIIISKGPKSILMPNLEKLPVQQARIILEENSLCQGQVSRTYSNRIKKNSIIAQVPSAGTMITRNQCVNLLVSFGIRPQGYKMPDLKGRFLDSAIPLVENSNLILGKITSVFYNDKPLNTIIAQEPLSGYSVTEGGTVNLVINRKPGRKGHGYSAGSPGGSFFRYRVNDGFLKRHIRVVLNSFGVSNTIFDEFIQPGEEIRLIIPNNNNTTVFLYEDDQLIKTRAYDDEFGSSF